MLGVMFGDGGNSGCLDVEGDGEAMLRSVVNMNGRWTQPIVLGCVVTISESGFEEECWMNHILSFFLVKR